MEVLAQNPTQLPELAKHEAAGIEKLAHQAISAGLLGLVEYLYDLP
jgi:hypothetical protein